MVITVPFSINCVHYAVRTDIPEHDPEPIFLNEQLGTSIDSVERWKLYLFENIKDFDSAVFYAAKDGGYVIEIASKEGLYRAINRDPRGLELLIDYFKLDEELYWLKLQIDKRVQEQTLYKKFMRKWQVINIDDCGLYISRHELERLYSTETASVKGGCIGCAAGLAVGIGVGMIINAVGEESNWGPYKINWNHVFDFFMIPIYATIPGTLSGSWAYKDHVINKTIDYIKKSREPVKIE